MSIERNIIFIYPVSKTLKDLKDSLEKEGNAVIYELDSVGEYEQIIGIVEHSITFSSDIKKTEGYLKRCKKLNKKPTNKNFLVQEKNVKPQMFAKYQRVGLNEVIMEGTNPKSLMYKINMFFSPFEQAAKKEEEAKNKAVMGNMTIKKETQKKEGEKEEYNSNERLRVEKTVDMTDDGGELKKNKKQSGFSLDAMLSSGATTNMDLKKSSTDTSMLKSPFDKFQRKKVAQFDPVDIERKMKKASFNPVMGELKNKNQKSLDLMENGHLNKKKGVDLGLEEQEFQKKKVKFEEALKEMNKKSIDANFEAAELNKKKVRFDELLRELEKKKGATFPDTEIGRKKKKQFEEFHHEMEKKRKEVELAEEELKKKKAKFEEVELDLSRKRKLLEDVNLDVKKKRAILEELEGLKKKKGAILDDVEALKKKKHDFEEVLNRADIKKMKFPDPEDVEKKKGAEIEEIDLNKKKGADFEAVEYEKKKLKFEEVEIDREKDNKENKEDEELKKKHAKFEEVEKEGKDFGELDLDKKDNEYKRAGFEEIGRENKLNLEQNVQLKKEVLLDTSFDDQNKKQYEEQILDYGEFKKERKQGLLKKQQEEEELRKKKELEDLLDEPEYKFFENLSYGLEYLIIHNDFLLKQNTTSVELFKFIHFAILKAYEGDVSFYLLTKEKDEEQVDALWSCLYSGHRARKNPILENDYDRYEAINIQEWLSKAIPFWRDETYQEEINEFVYPYFEDGKLLGIAVCHFKGTVNSHADASKIELLCMCLKGSILFESNNFKESA